MAGGAEHELAFNCKQVEAAALVFDVVAFPAETPQIRLATQLDKPTITGAEVIALQAALQFEAYTGVKLSAEQVRRASAFSRQSDSVKS